MNVRCNVQRVRRCYIVTPGIAPCQCQNNTCVRELLIVLNLFLLGRGPHPHFFKIKFVVLDEYLLSPNIFMDITGTAGIAPSRG